MNKRGISAVVASVLLILITVAAVSLIAGFVIPMVRENLEEGAGCFDLRDYGKIIDIGYTCYNPSAGTTSLTIERGMENLTIRGFAVSITSGASSKREDVLENLPGPGEAKTYTFGISGNKANLAVIAVSGKICDMGSYEINPC